LIKPGTIPVGITSIMNSNTSPSSMFQRSIYAEDHYSGQRRDWVPPCWRYLRRQRLRQIVVAISSLAPPLHAATQHQRLFFDLSDLSDGSCK
jgi:hypothetical protein